MPPPAHRHLPATATLALTVLIQIPQAKTAQSESQFHKTSELQILQLLYQQKIENMYDKNHARTIIRHTTTASSARSSTLHFGDLELFIMILTTVIQHSVRALEGLDKKGRQ